MARQRKSRTVSGQRIPVELKVLVCNLQREAMLSGNKRSSQDIYRMIARYYGRRRRG